MQYMYLFWYIRSYSDLTRIKCNLDQRVHFLKGKKMSNDVWLSYWKFGSLVFIRVFSKDIRIQKLWMVCVEKKMQPSSELDYYLIFKWFICSCCCCCMFVSFLHIKDECENANLAPHQEYILFFSYIILSYSLSKSEKATVVFSDSLTHSECYSQL